MRVPPQVVRNIKVEQFDRMYHINGLAIYDDGWKGWISKGYADFFTFPHVKMKPVFWTKHILPHLGLCSLNSFQRAW